MPPVAAQTWVGPGTDFHTGSNWDTGTAPDSTGIAIFSNFGPSDVSTSLNGILGGIVFASDAQNYNLTLNAGLNLYGGVENYSDHEQNITISGGRELFVGGNSNLGQKVNYQIDGTMHVGGSSNGGGETSALVNGRLVLSGAARTVEFGALNSLSNTRIGNYGLEAVTLRVGSLNSDMLLDGIIDNNDAALSLEKVGTGVLTLGGTNTYMGLTTITSGTLQLGNGGTKGTLGTAAVTNNASLAFNRSDSHTVTNVISGTGSVIQMGSGTTILTGQNTYRGGTVISAGTLQIGNGGLTGSLGSGPVVNNGSLIFNVTAIDVGNEISGNGSVTIRGTASLIGSNSYSGGTNINGFLYINSDSGLGASSGVVTMDQGYLNTLNTLTSARTFTIGSNGGVFAPEAGTELTLTGSISGQGSLTKNDLGTLFLTGVNTYRGNTILNGGVLSIAESSSLGSQGVIFVNGGNLQTTETLTLSQRIAFQTLGGEIRPDAGTALTLTGSLGGLNLSMNGLGTLILTGTNDYDTTALIAGTLQVGNGGTTGTLGSGAVTNHTSLVFNRSNAHIVANEISGTGYVTQAGSGTTILTGNNTYNGATSIYSGTLQVGNNGTSGSLGDTQIVVRAGAKLAFSRSNSLTVANQISGLGTIVKGGSGRLTLTSDLSDFEGDVSVTGGVLDVQSVVGDPVYGYGAVSVEAGGALTGTGRVGITNIASEGQLIGNAGQTLHIEALTLNSESLVTANLGAPSGTAASLFNVAGDLELNGQLNIVDQGGFGAGVYRLFDYGGQLTGAGLQFGGTPEGVLHTDLAIQTSIEGRVNLISSAGVDLRFWDGSTPANRDNKIIEGGSGTWSSTAGVWTDPNGLVNGTMKPNPAFTVFQGAAGTVTLDDSDGDLVVSGMQFITDGYALEGDGLTLAGAADQTVIRVGDGSPADAGITATIGADLTSTGDLVKRDGGTLVLIGSNSYRDTIVVGGTLIGNSSSLSGDISNLGTVVFDQADDATFSGAVAGLDGTDGRMAKRGTGTLTLTGNSGLDWDVEGGSLVTNTDLFYSNVNIAEGANLTFNQSADGIYAGVANGAGELVLSGGTTTTFTGDSSAFEGSVDVRASSLVVNGALGGSVLIGSGGSLAGAGQVGTTEIASGGQLVGHAGQTLEMDTLKLNSGVNVTANLGAPSGTAASLFDVAGDLELNGQLNIVDQGGFGAGVYRLFDYGGQLTGAGLQLGDTPEGVLHTDLAIQTSIEGRINLISSAGVDLRFWDGSAAANRDNNIIDGGSGTWSSAARVWTDSNGLVNGPVKPNPAFTVFQGVAGTVTLDDSDGDLAVSGMQFLTNGYAVEGDGLTLAGTDQLTVIRVGDGSPADAGITATIGADLTSTGDLVKRDGGTLVLTGSNSYRDTVVVAGTLIGNSASLSGDIFNLGTVVFDQAVDATFSGTVAGLDGTDGRMAKRGTGTLTLTGNSSLDWEVEGGSLVTNTDLFSGNVDISEGANLTFNQSADGIYRGVVIGAGQLVLSGGTSTAFTGDSSEFEGIVDVRASSLVVNGSLGGSVIIGSGSSLAGSGSLGNVTLGAGATIRPGNSIGTLAVGDITFANGSVFEVEVDATSNSSDLIAASGAATLNGGSVVHIGLNGDYRPTHTYTILTAAEGVNGEFADVTSDFAFLIPTLGYTGNEVTLTLARNDVNFDGVAQSFNQVATANALEAMGFGTPLYDVIIGLDEDGARLAFDGLSGEIHASVQSTLMEDSHFVRNAALDRMRSAGASVDPARGVTWWTQGLGSWGHIDGDGNASRITNSAKGVIMGFDTIAAETVQLGVYGGWQRSEVGIKRLSSDAKADGYHVGAYAGWDGDSLSLRGGVSYSWHNAEITRSINIADFSETIRSDRGISQAQAFAEIAFPVEFGSFALEPFAGITHVAQNAEAVNERGGDAAQRVDHTTMNTTFTTLGARASNSFNLGGLKADIRASGGWRRALGDRMPLAGVTFEGSEPFSVRGVRVAKNAASLDAGLGLDLSSSARLEVAYGGVISSTSQSHSGRATFSLAF